MHLQISKTVILILAICLSSCRQDKIIGIWKPVSDKISDKLDSSTSFEINLAQTDSLKSALLEERFGLQEEDELSPIDTAAIILEIDSTIAHFRSAYLQLNNDTSFLMVSNGFIIPTAMPGWHFGDSLFGNWSKHDSTLTLNFGDEDNNFSLKYHVLKLGNDSLVLREKQYGREAVGVNREITFVKE